MSKYYLFVFGMNLFPKVYTFLQTTTKPTKNLINGTAFFVGICVKVFYAEKLIFHFTKIRKDIGTKKLSYPFIFKKENM